MSKTMDDKLIFNILKVGIEYSLKKMKEYNEETQDDPNWNPIDDPVVGPGMHYD